MDVLIIIIIIIITSGKTNTAGWASPKASQTESCAICLYCVDLVDIMNTASFVPWTPLWKLLAPSEISSTSNEPRPFPLESGDSSNHTCNVFLFTSFIYKLFYTYLLLLKRMFFRPVEKSREMFWNYYLIHNHNTPRVDKMLNRGVILDTGFRHRGR